MKKEYPSVRMDLEVRAKNLASKALEEVSKELDESSKELRKRFNKCKRCKHFKWVEYEAPKSWLVECELEKCIHENPKSNIIS